jgi:hypothetical protein
MLVNVPIFCLSERRSRASWGAASAAGLFNALLYAQGLAVYRPPTDHATSALCSTTSTVSLAATVLR